VPAVTDEELGPELAFEIADLLRERRSRKMKPLCGPTEMQFLGNGDEVGQLSEFHAVDGRAAVIGGAYQSLVISRGPNTRTSVDSDTGPSRCEAKDESEFPTPSDVIRNAMRRNRRTRESKGEP
jgi:hypothetical protein